MSTRNSVCQCGNCGVNVTAVSITITSNNGDRSGARFCSELHAAIWLLDQASHYDQRDGDKTKAIIAGRELFNDLKHKSA